MKSISYFVVLFIGLHGGFFDSAFAKSQTKSIEKETLKRKPNSDGDCGNGTERIQQNYVQEFGLADNDARNVVVDHINVSGKTFARAMHQSQCSPKGCGSTLSFIRPGVCPKLVLVFNGFLVFTGGEGKRYSRLQVRYKSESIDGRPSIYKFEFDENEMIYKELKK